MNIYQAANTLERILDRINESIDDWTKLKIRKELIEFKRSLPWEPEFAELRRIAQETFEDLGRSVNQSVLFRMRERSKEFDQYIEKISAEGTEPKSREEPEDGSLPGLEVAKEPPEPLQPTPRYADFSLFYGKGTKNGEKVPANYPLQVERWYQLEVAVRVKPIGIPPEKLERRAIREPKQKEDVTLMVTLEGDGVEVAEPCQTLVLPPLGDSTENAFFEIRPIRESGTINDLAKMRVRLYYEFNILEVAVIMAEVVGKFDSATESRLGLTEPISFRQERLEREYVDFDNVQPRIMHIDITKKGERFLFNFAFYNESAQKLVFTAPARLPAQDLEDDLVSIRKIWYDVAMSETFSKHYEGDKSEFVANIRKFAKAGRRLWIKLFKRERKSSIFKIGLWLERHPLRRDGIIQISFSEDAAEFVFPWALIYDRPVPRKKHDSLDLDGFWGVRYCIELQVPNSLWNADDTIRVERGLKLDFMVWDDFRNSREEKRLMEYLVSNSAGMLEVGIPPTNDADACYELLLECNSDILYFYTHGYTRHRQADIGVGPDLDLFVRRYESFEENSSLRDIYRPLYESIKREEFEPDRSWIELSNGKLYLDELYDSIEAFSSSPFVILNMCESAQITPSLSDSFVHFFLDRGAIGILGTECPMTIEFAHPFAEKFLEGTLRGGKIGHVLLECRRYFLEHKNPLGLAYTLFGSATVCFKPPVVQFGKSRRL